MPFTGMSLPCHFIEGARKSKCRQQGFSIVLFLCMEQCLCRRVVLPSCSRRLITMEKHNAYCASLAAAHKAAGITPSHLDRVADCVHGPRGAASKKQDESQRQRNRYRGKNI